MLFHITEAKIFFLSTFHFTVCFLSKITASTFSFLRDSKYGKEAYVS